MRELTVSAIKEGTVIDHIPANATFKVVSILKLQDFPHTVTVATNLESKTMGKKGLVKVSNKTISKSEADAISIIAPLATLNIIDNYKVIKKTQLAIPDKLENVLLCSNPDCITNHYSTPTTFYVLSKKPLVVRCRYCERIMEEFEIQIKE